MMTSSNGNIFRVTGLCAGNSPVTGEFSSQRPVTRRFVVFFDLRQNKRLSKHSWGFDLKRHRAHYDVIVMCTEYVQVTPAKKRAKYTSRNQWHVLIMNLQYDPNFAKVGGEQSAIHTEMEMDSFFRNNYWYEDISISVYSNICHIRGILFASLVGTDRCLPFSS